RAEKAGRQAKGAVRRRVMSGPQSAPPLPARISRCPAGLCQALSLGRAHHRSGLWRVLLAPPKDVTATTNAPAAACAQRRSPHVLKM
ncbi:MAG: hypothetical protein AAGH45_12235, partial [Pseudomonadota bacterium]